MAKTEEKRQLWIRIYLCFWKFLIRFSFTKQNSGEMYTSIREGQITISVRVRKIKEKNTDEKNAFIVIIYYLFMIYFNTQHQPTVILKHCHFWPIAAKMWMFCIPPEVPLLCAKLKGYFWNFHETQLQNDCISIEWWYVTKNVFFSSHIKQFQDTGW